MQVDIHPIFPVSIIIVSWNAEEWIESCIKSVLLQTVKPLEIIVVDNASVDGSVQMIRGKFKNVKVIEAGANLGFAAANNLAVKKMSSQSSWVVLLNPDAFPEPTWLEMLLAAAGANPEYVFFGSRLMSDDIKSQIDGIGDRYHYSGLVWRARNGMPLVSSDKHKKEIFSPCAAAAMYRTDIFIHAGGFDEDFFCYVEDVDLGFRLRLIGHRCLYVPDSVVYHKGSASTGVGSDFSIYYGHRNIVWTYVKNMPGILFWIFLPFHILLNAASILWFIKKGKGRVILRSKHDAIKALPLIWRRRKQIQSVRKVSIINIWKMIYKGMNRK